MDRDMIVADAGMLIRRPIAVVFEALIDPEVTTRFWFTSSTGKLEAVKRVRWDWEMYDHSVDVDVDVVDENERLVMRWPAYQAGEKPPSNGPSHLARRTPPSSASPIPASPEIRRQSRRKR
jgi:uncharacterized protein YndB with AHSA1/START domain